MAEPALRLEVETGLRWRRSTEAQSFDLGTVSLSNVTPRGYLDYLIANTTGSDTFQGQLAGPAGQELMAGFDAHIADPQAASITMKVSGAMVAKK